MSVNMVISFSVKQESLNDFRAIMNDVKVNLPKVEGCHNVKILNDLENPLAFTLVEAWESKERHGAHVQGLVDSGAWNSIAAHLAAAPVSAYYSEV
jgi:quinol monooxygenase YgiN